MDLDDDADDNAPLRFPEAWFEDGNIVIQAENTQFRVYRGVLAAKSPVFQDMFSITQPVDSEIVEGCPLIRLPDVAAEVAVFLKAIFDSSFFEPFPSPTQIESIIGILRLSHKYDVGYLKRRALSHLSARFPTELGDFRNVEPGKLWPQWQWQMVPRRAEAYISVIQLARETETFWILPCAFYDLADARLTGQSILNSTGVVTFNGRTVELSEGDKVALLDGYLAQLNAGTSEVMRFWHATQVPDCTTRLTCLTTRMQAIEMIRDCRADSNYQCDPLFIWSGDDWDDLNELCAVCIRSLKRAHGEARQAFWDRLPQLYELPSWEELRELKSEALGS